MLIQWLRLRPAGGIRPVPEERTAARPAPWRRAAADPQVAPPIVARLVEKFGDAIEPVVPVFRGEAATWVRRERVVEVCRHLRDVEGFDMLIDLCGVHAPERPRPLEVVIHLYALATHARLRLKVALAEGEACPSLTGVWSGAGWHEREAFDLVGVPFSGHPDLRRILLPDDFDGHPLRKDFPLKG